MPLDSNRLRQVVKDSFGKLPHPDLPELTNDEYPVYERVARMKMDPHKPSHMDVRDVYNELTAVDLSPHAWEHAWEISRPLANRLLGRDPNLQELIRHGEAHPTEIHDYYSNLPSRSHPEIKAGVMAQYTHMASPIASQHLERAPLLQEVAHFASAGYKTEHIDAHYRRMAQERE